MYQCSRELKSRSRKGKGASQTAKKYESVQHLRIRSLFDHSHINDLSLRALSMIVAPTYRQRRPRSLNTLLNRSRRPDPPQILHLFHRSNRNVHDARSNITKRRVALMRQVSICIEELCDGGASWAWCSACMTVFELRGDDDRVSCGVRV